MRRELSGDRLFLHRDEAERRPLVRRLRRVEGQIRGIIDMIETDRHCGDELQQINAVRAALREVATMLALQHVEAAAEELRDRGSDEAIDKDLRAVLKAALGQS